MSELLCLLNNIAVGLFGCVLSAAFCGALSARRNRWILAGGMVVIFALQGAVYFLCDPSLLRKLYPLLTHLPLWLLLCFLTKKRLWSLICVLTAYLCCQLRRWIALLVVAMLAGDPALQVTAELAVTLPLLLVLLYFVAPAVSLLQNHPVRIQCQFGLIPALGYGFDYLTRIYTDLLYSGVPVAVEFMPFVCCVAYLVFLLRSAADEQGRSRMEQTQNSLTLQITQSKKEIELLREAQEKASSYRHDLRHHLQYLSACMENGQLAEAQAYIHGLCDEIEAHTVRIHCENEAVNLVLSSFAGRAATDGIALKVQAALPKHLMVSDSDLCVLLSNALENALHACQSLSVQGVSCSIEVRLHEKAGKLFLQIINPCAANLSFEQGIPVTSVPGHGIGVRSICAIVEKYGGVYDFSTSNDQFILRLSL